MIFRFYHLSDDDSVMKSKYHKYRQVLILGFKMLIFGLCLILYLELDLYVLLNRVSTRFYNLHQD